MMLRGSFAFNVQARSSYDKRSSIFTMGRTPIENRLHQLHVQLADVTSGKLADYIPQLSQADPRWFGLATTTAEGEVYCAGDSGLEFSIQSVSKPFVYAMALMDRGEDYVLDHVGIEPTGDPFNAVTLSSSSGKPLNPMVNAGAIVTSTMVTGADHRERTERILEGLSRFAGRDLTIDQSVAKSEFDTSDRNRAISYLMRGAGSLSIDVEDALSTYIAQCSVLINVKDLSIMAATLAAGGRNPITTEQVVPPELIAQVLTIMTTCGMYDGAGEWMYRVGLPAKSGVSGAIMAVLPNQLGLATWSPPLDERGNSVRGEKAMGLLSDDLDLHVFFPTGTPQSPIRRVTTTQVLRARTGRNPAEQLVLNESGEQIRIVELHGSIGLLGAQQVVECVSNAGDGTRWLLIDARQVADLHPGALKIINEAFVELVARGTSVEVVESQRGGIQRTTNDWRVPMNRDRDLVLERFENELIMEEMGVKPHQGIAVSLNECQILNQLSSAELAAIAPLLVQSNEPAGTVLVAPGTKPSGIFWILSGEVDLLVPVTGLTESTRLRGIGPGAVFGELTMVERAYDRGSAVTTQASVIAKLDASMWDHITADQPGLRSSMLCGLAELLAIRQRRLLELLDSLAETQL